MSQTGKWLNKVDPVVVITDGTLGTASDALAEITASYVEATIANSYATLAAKVNELVVIVNQLSADFKARGIMEP